jgi:ubiquinone/menaquinone biosynthesis C-methylase UbiE
MSRFTLAKIWSPKMYNWLSKHYDSLASLFAPGGVEAQQRLVEDMDQGSILDIGCGTGTLLELARSRNLDCYGLDNSPGMLNLSKKKIPSATLVLGSFYDIPFPENTFDYVVETHALSGVDIDAYRGLTEMLRVCKIGGEIRIADYAVPPVETNHTRLLTRLGSIIGDYPINYSQFFRSRGYHPRVEILGSHDMYQLICMVKV